MTLPKSPSPFQSFPPLQLKDLLASNASVDEEDVLNVKRRLNALGHYQSPIEEITLMSDHGLFAGIKSFQREQGLTVDGYMKPGGETEKALNETIANQATAEPPRPDPAAERREAVIAFAGKYGIPEDKAREYMAKPSIFNFSRLRQDKAEAEDTVTPSGEKGDGSVLGSSWPDALGPTAGEVPPAPDQPQVLARDTAPDLSNAAPTLEQQKKQDGAAFWDTGGAQLAANTHAKPRTSPQPQAKTPPQPQSIQDAASAAQKYQQGNVFRAQVAATAQQARTNAYDGPRFSSGVAVDNFRGKYPPEKEAYVVKTPARNGQPEILKPEWHEYFNAVMAARATPRQANAQKNLFAIEGGMTTPKDNPTITPGGFLPDTRATLLGLADKTDAELDKYPTRRQALNQLRAAGLTTKDAFKKASPSQVAAAHRAYFDYVLAPAGGFDAIETIPDDHAASALADTMFQHGASGGTLILQRAINRRLKELGKSTLISEDEQMGPDVLTHYNDLVSDRKNRQQLLNYLADERQRYMMENGQKIGPGEKTRFTYYRG